MRRRSLRVASRPPSLTLPTRGKGTCRIGRGFRMRIVVHGQQAFGKAVLEALTQARRRSRRRLCRAGEGGRQGRSAEGSGACRKASGLSARLLQEARGVGGIQSAQAGPPGDGFRDAVRAGRVSQFPTHGSIQYHPSLLPAYRGASAINWPIIKGETETGLSIFWPDNGLDTGDVLLQKTTPIGPVDTLGTVYFDRLFPMGVEAMLESVDLVKGRQGAAHSSRTKRRRPTKAAAAPTTPGSIGVSRGSRSTG